MSVRRSAMARAQRQVRISSPVALDKRREQLGYDALSEIEQQFQLPISGLATGLMSFTSTTVDFDVEFFDAPEQRDSSLAFPHFTYGTFIDIGLGQPTSPRGAVLVTAVVQDWVTDVRGAFTGAQLDIGACLPGLVNGSIRYTGYIHLTFQGYGALKENIPELDVGT